MVSNSLGKKCVIVGAVLVIVVAICFLTTTNHERCKEAHGVGDSPCRPFIPEYSSIGGSTLADLIGQSYSVVSSYTNCHIGIMQDKLVSLLNRCERIPPSQFSDVVGPITHVLRSSFFEAALDSHASSCDEFESFLALNRMLIECLAKCEIKRRCYTEIIMSMECLYLRQLQAYYGIFRERGHHDLMRVLEREIKSWIQRIDSPASITRHFVLWELGRNLVLVKEGMTSRENVLKGCLMVVKPLARSLGRDPKWIDEIK